MFRRQNYQYLTAETIEIWPRLNPQDCEGGKILTFRKRVVDSELHERLGGNGAVLIEGPKACGKTETALQIANSSVMLDIGSKRNSHWPSIHRQYLKEPLPGCSTGGKNTRASGMKSVERLICTMHSDSSSSSVRQFRTMTPNVTVAPADSRS